MRLLVRDTDSFEWSRHLFRFTNVLKNVKKDTLNHRHHGISISFDMNKCKFSNLNKIGKIWFIMGCVKLEQLIFFGADWLIGWLVDFNDISSRIRLFYGKRVGNRVHCTYTFIFIFCVKLFLRRFFYILHTVLMDTNNFKRDLLGL